MQYMRGTQQASVTIAVVAIASLAVLTLADTTGVGGVFEFSFHTIESGGGASSGGVFELNGTIGQPEAGSALAGGTFELLGGYWAASIPVQPTCPVDVNHDGVINVTDLLAVINAWGQTGNHPADVTDDGIVDVADLLAVISQWGMCS